MSNFSVCHDLWKEEKLKERLFPESAGGAGSPPARHPGAVHHLGPLLLIGGHFDVVAVGALVAVPQQQPEQKPTVTSAAAGWKAPLKARRQR